MEPETISTNPDVATALWTIVAAACILAVVLWLIETIEEMEDYE
jgi:hypothetical protein